MTEEEAEAQALEVLHRGMREDRRTPRRHQLIALLVVLPILGVIVALAALLANQLSGGR